MRLRVWWLAVLAGVTQLTAGATLSGLVGLKVAGFATLVVGALQSGTAAYQAASDNQHRRRTRKAQTNG